MSATSEDSGNTWSGTQVHEYAWVIAGTCALWATLISLHLIYKHFRNYTRPALQRPIIRIILMVPIYSFDSFLSLRFKELALYFDLGRDCYEAYVLYMFFTLLVNFLEAEGGTTLENLLEDKDQMSHPFPLCMLKFQPGRSFLMWCKFCVLQFALVKPVLTLLALLMEAFGVFDEGSFSPRSGYLYVALLDNVSISMSLYCLVLFYMTTREELQGLKPVPKFLCIKAIIFFSFWQGVIINFISWFGAFHKVGSWSAEQITTGLQDFIICVEMFAISVAHSWIFGYEEYRILDKEPFFRGLIKGDIKATTNTIVSSFKDAMHPKYDIQSTTSTLAPAARHVTQKVKSIPERLPLIIHSGSPAGTDYDSD